MRKKILIVDDEKPIADILKFNLEKEGYEIHLAHDGQEALDKVEAVDPDLILLDIMLPIKDGLEVCREVRKKRETPIIMLTAKDSEIDKVLGLELGADDYVTKPFSARELLARVKANLRRFNAFVQEEKEATSEIVVGDIKINQISYQATKNGELIELTQREFELLLYLAKHTGQVLTREHLLQTVWGFEYYGDLRTVDVTVRRLREKIEDNPSSPSILLTRRGIGYVIRDIEKE